ncbi:MAG: ribosome maturation factor RimM [Eubacteriaceae bacterium]|nr:ribosome maturation factor RimM [Eubacteriaceae bacterium]
MKTEIVIGKVLHPHGIRGEAAVYPLTDDINRFLDLSYIICGDKRFEIQSARIHKKTALLKLEGIDTRNGIEKLCGLYVSVKREDAAALSEGEYYIEDLKGIHVADKHSSRSGTLIDILQHGAADVLVIEEDGKQKLMAWLNEDVGPVDLDAGIMFCDFSKLVD